MPLNDMDRAWIHQEIQTAFSKRGIVGFLKDWGPLIGLGAIMLGLLGQWTNYVEFRTNTKDRLGQIETKLTQLGLQTKVAVPQKEFEANLPDLRKAIVTAREEKVSVSPGVIKDLQNKLVITPDTAPTYWQTAADLVSYGSVITASWLPRATKTTSANSATWSGFPTLPICIDSQPKITEKNLVDMLPHGDVTGKFGEYQTCRFEIDSPQEQQRLDGYLHNVPEIVFYRCLIVYRGGDITLPFDTSDVFTTTITNTGPSFTVTAQGPAIHFYECVFDFTVRETPPGKGQELIKFALRQTPKGPSPS
jgi:hypothetical protein